MGGVHAARQTPSYPAPINPSLLAAETNSRSYSSVRQHHVTDVSVMRHSALLRHRRTERDYAEQIGDAQRSRDRKGKRGQ